MVAITAPEVKVDSVAFVRGLIATTFPHLTDMNRRQFLTSAAIAGLGGCTSDGGGSTATDGDASVGGEGSVGTATDSPTATPTETATPTATDVERPLRTPAPEPSAEGGEFTIGETYRAPTGMVVGVLDLATVEADEDGKRAALAFAHARNSGDEVTYTPAYFSWSILAGDTQYDAIPSNDDERFESGEIHPGVVREGWVLFAIDDDLRAEDLSVVLADGSWVGGLDNQTATWSW